MVACTFEHRQQEEKEAACVNGGSDKVTEYVGRTGVGYTFVDKCMYVCWFARLITLCEVCSELTKRLLLKML